MSPTYVFDRTNRLPGNPNADPSAYKYRDDPWKEPKRGPEQPTRGSNAHEPTPMLEVFAHPWQRLYQCPICKEGYELDAESKAVGVDCAGDAMRESVEDANE